MRRRDQLYHNETHASKESCESIAKNAKDNRCWINYKKEWYTPDEFVTAAYSHSVHLYRGYSNFELQHIKIKDPRDLIARMDAYLNSLAKKRNDLADKISKYYNASYFNKYKPDY